MYIAVFAVLMAIALILIIAAEVLDVTLNFPAFALIFLLGMTILLGNLSYQTGETISVNYTYLPDNTTINMTSQTTTAEYTYYNTGYNHIIGFVLAVIGVFGNVLTWVHYGKRKKKEKDRQDTYEWGSKL